MTKPVNTVSRNHLWLRCPFCGDSPKIDKVKDKRFKISCIRTLCFMKPDTSWHIKEVYAIKAWNTRTKKDEAKDES